MLSLAKTAHPFTHLSADLLAGSLAGLARYVGADHALGWAVVSVRGTLNRTDIWTDLAADALPFAGGHVHRGIFEATHRGFSSVVRLRQVLSQAWFCQLSFYLSCSLLFFSSVIKY